jgi:hypothetical protein
MFFDVERVARAARRATVPGVRGVRVCFDNYRAVDDVRLPCTIRIVGTVSHS